MVRAFPPLVLALMVGTGIPTIMWVRPSHSQEQFPQQFQLQTLQLQQGTVIPTSSSSNQEPQYFANDTVQNTTFTVSQPIYDTTGRLVIPVGSVLAGQMVPVQGGLRFVASTLTVNGRVFSIQASSPLIHDEKDPRQVNTQSTAEDAVIGAAAGTLLGVLTGGVTTTGVLGGATAGVIVGNVTAPQVVVIRPNQPINITLEAPLRI